LSYFRSENQKSKWQSVLLALGIFVSITLFFSVNDLLFKENAGPSYVNEEVDHSKIEASYRHVPNVFFSEKPVADPYGYFFEYSSIGDGTLLAAAKSPNKKINPKRKSAKKIKKSSPTKKKSVGATRKRAKSIEESKRTSMGFFEYGFIGLVGLTLFGLFLRYQREFDESQSDVKDLTTAPSTIVDRGYQPKAVVLSEPNGPDPLTYQQTDVFQKVSGKKSYQSVTLDLSLDCPELERSISNEIDEIISSIKVLDQNTEQPIPQMLLLPAEMIGHFEAMPGEVLVWSAPLFVKGVCEGMLAITNLRLLALYERRIFKLIPPSIIFQTKRNQALLHQISLYKPVQVNRPSFLAAGAVVFWWFPFGTIGACAAIAAYLFFTRRELGVWTPKQKRTYPLSMVDLEEAMSSIGKITGVHALGRVDVDKRNGKKAG